MTMTRRSNGLMHIFRHRQTSPMKSTTFDKPSKKENRWIAITFDFDNSPKREFSDTDKEIKEHIRAIYTRENETRLM